MTQSTFTLTVQSESFEPETNRGCNEQSVCFQWVLDRNTEKLDNLQKSEHSGFQYTQLLTPANFKSIASIIEYYNVLNVKYSVSFTSYVEQDPKNKSTNK